MTGDAAPRDPWADPATPTEPGAPYTGPPPTTPPVHPVAYPPPYGQQWPSGQAPYGQPYGYPAPWGPMPPRGPRRPGQVIAASVLCHVQAAVVAVSSLYLWMILSIGSLALRRAPTVAGDALITEGTVLTVVQAVSVVALIAAGILALTRRGRTARLVVLGASAVQVVLAVYWAVRLQAVLADVAGNAGGGAFTAFPLFFAAAPLVATGLVLFGAGRRWFDGTPRP